MDAPAYDTVLTNLRTRIREIEDGVDDAACLTHASSHQEDPNESDRAFQKILRCASVREQSSARMRSKLKNADFSSEAIDRAIAKSVELGIVDDERYADALIRQTISSGKGLRFALREIEELDVDLDKLDSYRQYKEEEDGTELDRALAVLSKHPPRAKNVRDAAYRKLVSKGYSPETSASCARIWSEKIEGE